MEDNVEIVRRLIASMRDYWRGEGSWDEMLRGFYDPDADYYPVRKFPESQPCHGPDEIAEFMAAYNEAWETSAWEILDITVVGDDRVLMRTRLSGTGRGSGMDLAGEVFHCFWLRNGRVFRQEDHLTEAGAKRALGIE